MQKVSHLLPISLGADIDTLCVVPTHVSRQDFFGSFFEELKGMEAVTEITQVPEAYVPIMKLVFDGISVFFVILMGRSIFCSAGCLLKPFQTT